MAFDWKAASASALNDGEYDLQVRVVIDGNLENAETIWSFQDPEILKETPRSWLPSLEMMQESSARLSGRLLIDRSKGYICAAFPGLCLIIRRRGLAELPEYPVKLREAGKSGSFCNLCDLFVGV